MATDPHVYKDFSGLKGPWMLGVQLNCVLAGCIIVQAWSYAMMYSDTWKLRAFVALLVALSLFDCALNIATIYDQFVLGFGDYVRANASPMSNTIHVYIAPTINLICQTFFAARAFKILLPDKLLACSLATLMGLLIALTAVGGYATAAWPVNSISTFQTLLTWIQIWTWSSAVCDMTISSVFIWRMRTKFRSAFEGTNSVVTSLVKMALSTASFTALLALANAINGKIQSTTSNWQLLWNFMLPRSHVICVLFVLNARQRLRLVGPSGQSGSGDSVPNAFRARALSVSNKVRLPSHPGQGDHRLAGRPIAERIEVQLQTFVHHESPGTPPTFFEPPALRSQKQDVGHHEDEKTGRGVSRLHEHEEEDVVGLYPRGDSGVQRF